MAKVLVLDCWMRKGLSIVRALGREGLEVHSCGHKSINPIRFSKYSRKFMLFPHPEKEPDKFLDKLIDAIKNEKYDCVFPLEEGTIEVLYKRINEIKKYTKLPMVNQATFEKAVDKWNSVKIAKRLGMPVPESYLPQNDEEARKAITKLGFPIILKPRKTSGGRGLKKVNNIEEFNASYPSIVEKYGRPMLQEYIEDGPGVLVWAIVKNKKILAEFSYKRLRKYPIDSGPGTLWESTDNREIKKYTEKMAKELDWYSIIILEFKTDPKDNRPKFMEINPRLGGSTAHPLFCGVNFPYYMYLLSQNIKFKKPSYVVGRRTRWLVADTWHFFSNKNRWSMQPSFFDFFNRNVYYEEFDRTDIKGSIGTIMNSFLNIFDIEIWKKGIFRK